MKRIIAGILAISICLSLSACNNNNASGTSATESFSENNSNNGNSGDSKPLSNPVAVDADGNVDMSVALAYQTDIDAFLKSMEEKTVDGTKLVSENSSEKTEKVFDWLQSVYGKQMISGQQYSNPKNYENIMYYNTTGDMPAIMGFDFIQSTQSETTEANNEQVDQAIEWHTKSNGLVSMCWHWRVPIDIDNPDKGVAFYSDEITNFNVNNAVTPGTKEYEVIIRDIDTIAIQLQRMEAAGVPVIFRPFHEGSGSWFWWGFTGKQYYLDEIYQKLWYILYDRMENYHKLTNLIWLWNGQNKYCAVNPNTYDIAGTDIYPNSEDHSAQTAKHTALGNITAEGKMLALSECGYIPDPDEVFAEDSTAKWLYYCPWCTEFVCKVTESNSIVTDLYGTPSVNTDRMSEAFLKKVFASEKVITWSELPDWGNTTRDLPEYITLWQAFK